MHWSIIIGSVRMGRNGPAIAKWVAKTIAGVEETSSEIVDLEKWPLPMDDEPYMPITGPYTKEHTIRWSKKIQQSEAFIFVVPEYNSGYPAALKNALDHIYKEWNDKPAVLVAYGGDGGVEVAPQISKVLNSLKMLQLEPIINVKLGSDMLPPDDIDRHDDELVKAIKSAELIQWELIGGN